MQALVSATVVVAVFFGVLPRIADLSEVWAAIRAMTALEAFTLVGVALWNLATYSFVQACALPGLRLDQATVATQSATAIANVVPGGAAVGLGVNYAMYASWGFRRAAVALSLLVAGVWNNFAKVGLPVVALAVLAVQGQARRSLVVASLAGVAILVASVAVFGVMLRSPALARRVGTALERVVIWLRRLVGRGPVRGWGEAAVRFRAQTIGLVRRRGAALTAITLVSHMSLFLVLLVALRHVGVSDDEVSWAEVLGAFAFVRLLSALPITPGGLGVVELGLTAALSLTGADRELVVAGVLVYRALTYVLQIPVGAVGYLVWRRKASWRQSPPEQPSGREALEEAGHRGRSEAAAGSAAPPPAPRS